MVGHTVHRLVAFAFCDNPNNHNVVDHIDRNPLNNMFTNLRWVSQRINMRNQKLSVTNKSGFQGVSYDDKKDRWCVKVSGDNMRRMSKSFACKKHGEEQAKQMAIDQSKLWRAEFGYIED